MKLKFVLLVAVCFQFLPGCTQSPSWKGTLVYNHAGDINTYNLSNKANKPVVPEARDPFAFSANEIWFINEKFPNRGQIVKKTGAGGQFSEALNLTNDNPVYKPQLENYSVINGTGISGIMQYMDAPKISPDRKYIAVTILGGYRNAFTENCVAVFDVATQQLVKKFDNKYYGCWMPDGRLVMSGTFKRRSTEKSMYAAKTPGIFIADKSLSTIKRIDPQLNDPSPYHATPSPDGKRIAYVMNDHVWIMNADGTGNKQLTDADNDNAESFPTFSPDGKFIATWSFKTFERSYYTAIAIVDANAAKPVVLSDKAPVWPRDGKKDRISGGSGQINWLN